jgi:hypothetical protein
MRLVLTSATQSNKSLGVLHIKHFYNVYCTVSAVSDQTMKGLRYIGIVSRIQEERIRVSIKIQKVRDRILFIWYCIHFRARMVEIQQNANKCTTLQYKTFAIEALELTHVLTLCGSSSGMVHQ